MMLWVYFAGILACIIWFVSVVIGLRLLHLLGTIDDYFILRHNDQLESIERLKQSLNSQRNHDD
jgi:hypothetical protein